MVKRKFLQIDLFYFNNFFGLDFFKFSSPLSVTGSSITPIIYFLYLYSIAICEKLPISNKTSASSNRQRRPSKKLLSASAPATLTSNNLLGNFEESVLNGRLEPNSTVEGFTAEIGASGSFQPKHRTLPVTVFFYTLCDNAAYSSPYLGN